MRDYRRSKCGLSERTLHRWLTDEAFQAEYAAARQAAFQAGIHRAQALTGRHAHERRREPAT